MKPRPLVKIAQDIEITAYQDYRDWLLELYQSTKRQNPSYSYAIFSSDLKLGSSNANLVIHRKRNLTANTGKKIADALNLGTKQRQYLMAQIEYECAKSPQDRETAFSKMLELKQKHLKAPEEKKMLDFFSDWYNAAILEFLRLPDASDHPEWIATHLKPSISLVKVKKSLQLLQELNLIILDKKKGRLVPNDSKFSMGDQVPGLAIMRFHQQMIELGKHSLDTQDYERREISSLTMAIPSDLLEKIKDQIISFRKTILQQVEHLPHSDEVVQLNFQLFSLGGTERDAK